MPKKKTLKGRHKGHKGSMQWEKPEPIKVPDHVLQKTCEEFAKKVRDGVNSHLGRDRLSITLFHPWSDQSVTILMHDTDAPEGMDRLTLGWDMDCDADETIRYLLESEIKADEPKDDNND